MLVEEISFEIVNKSRNHEGATRAEDSNCITITELKLKWKRSSY